MKAWDTAPLPKSSSSRRALFRIGARTAGDESAFAWVRELLELWARWSSAGGVGGSGILRQYTDDDTPGSTAGDSNGTAYDTLMLDVDAAIRALPPSLYKPVRYYYLQDMGRSGAARACGLSDRGFDGRLALAHYHVARLLRSRR